eukprot:TRINITY_DN55047_c0_g1_i1.p1 TRINITY_DN55047_c0_g1~~TRINITY_DN55047_c0_g1_i1.p1  ORF type:complete len:204 (-),score=44.88 TRINITY_DN55047_c0_g1_i1:151-762(-)
MSQFCSFDYLLQFVVICIVFCFFFFQAEDGIRDVERSRGLGDVYKRQVSTQSTWVEKFCRLNTWGETIIKKEDIAYVIDDFAEVDSTFFELFSIPLLKGNSKTVLNEPNTMVLSESTAKKVFGNEDPINKMLRVNTGQDPYRITGVMADFPEETHFNANILTSFMTNRRANDPEWLNNSFSTYVLLKPNTSPATVEELSLIHI